MEFRQLAIFFSSFLVVMIMEINGNIRFRPTHQKAMGVNPWMNGGFLVGVSLPDCRQAGTESSNGEMP